MDKVGIKLDVGFDFKKLDKDLEKLKKRVAKTEINIGTGNITKQMSDLEKLITKAIERTNVKAQKDFYKNQVRASKEFSKELKKELTVRDKVQNAISKTMKKREEEIRKINKNQAKHINKALEQKMKQQEIDAKTLLGTFDKLKKKQLQNSDVANILSKKYGDLEVRAKSLDQITGKYSVTLKKSAKENLVLKGSIDKTTGALRVQSKTIKQARNIQLGFFEQFKEAAKKVPIWLGATTVFFQTAKFGRTMVEDISNINKSMIELQKVSNATESQLNAFKNSTPKIAKNLGVLNNQVINVTAQVSKLGFTLKEAKKLSEISLLAKTVGDLDSVNDSLDYLISSLKGYGLNVNKDAQKIVDYMNHVSNTTSISFSNIGEGYKRMSSAMAEANNSIQQSTGLLVAGYDITRSSEITSRALIFSAYMQ